jgi:hypothetical protein
MRRIQHLAIGFAGLFLLASNPAQSAVTFSVSSSVASGNALDELVIGDLVTFDITLRSDGEAAYAIGASAFGWDSTRIQYVSGVSAPSVLNSVCVSEGCFGGLPLGRAGDYPNQYGRPGIVEFAGHLSLAAATGTGALDPGVVTGVAGDPQFRLVFETTALGSTQFEFGSSLDIGDVLVLDGGELGEVENAFAAITVLGGAPVDPDGGNPIDPGGRLPIDPGGVNPIDPRGGSAPIPEPGAALLMAVGMACVSLSTRRRERA